ncbi:sigma-70 family RNA polymerase sigma factor, partial [Actinocorallia lasiicapitis]
MGESTVAEPGDAALISRMREGDTGAYALLYERHVAAAKGLARHLTSSDAEVDDAVSETFTKVLAVIQRGGGPSDSFRPYLLTSVRRTIYDRQRSGKRESVTDEIELYDPGVPFVDPALEGLEQKIIVRAFLSLPERWQAVLWHTEIEGRKPADVAPVLGLSANGVAALAYRAREGLKQAYLQMHLAAAPPKDCRPTLDILGSYVRGGLAKKETAKVESHLDDCGDCRAIYLELKDLNRSLRTLVGPLILGVTGSAFLLKGGIFGGALFWWKALPKRQQQALAGGTAAAVAVAATALALSPTG